MESDILEFLVSTMESIQRRNEEKWNQLDDAHVRIATSYGKIISREEISTIQQSFIRETSDLIDILYGKADINVSFASAVPRAFKVTPTNKDGVSILPHISKLLAESYLFDYIEYIPKGSVTVTLPDGKHSFIWRPEKMDGLSVGIKKKIYSGFEQIVSELEKKHNLPVQIDLLFYTNGKEPTIINYGSTEDVPILFNRRPDFKDYTRRQQIYDSLEKIDGKTFERAQELKDYLTNLNKEIEPASVNISGNGKLIIFGFRDEGLDRLAHKTSSDETVGLMTYKTDEYTSKYPERFGL